MIVIKLRTRKTERARVDETIWAIRDERRRMIERKNAGHQDR